MAETKRIKTALVSVYHKEGLGELLALLNKGGVKFISTGGTREFIESQGYECAAVDDLTGYPAILDGRVKTLHPKVFGAILNIRDNESHRQETSRYGIPDIDLVIVDLYPFEATVDSGASEADIIEKIDIGGISLIRAAAKNFQDVTIVASKAQYPVLRAILEKQGASTTLEQRKQLAACAFAVSSGYDSAIFNWFSQVNECAPLRIAVDGVTPLRYGENPHQQATFHGDLSQLFTQLHGKEISYNNLLDIDSALGLVAEFAPAVPTCAVLKHNNPCGLAARPTAKEAWEKALEGDPQSAFGGVIAFNCPVDEATAQEVGKIFFEVIVAPGFSAEALDILKQKKNRIILDLKAFPASEKKVRSCLDGVLVQSADRVAATVGDLDMMTEKEPTDAQVLDLLFAEKVVKHCKSNAIAIAKDGQLVGTGVGQTSRVDAMRQAIDKARAFNLPLEGASLASDAFFPFDDCVKLAHEAGIAAIIQPAGSVRDADSVDYCNKNSIPMVKTGKRHFRH